MNRLDALLSVKSPFLGGGKPAWRRGYRYFSENHYTLPQEIFDALPGDGFGPGPKAEPVWKDYETVQEALTALKLAFKAKQ
jgi:hypothetical protein